MKKYEIKKAFSVLEKALLIPGDEVYAEETRLMYSIYSIKTRKIVGRVSSELFKCSTKEIRDQVKKVADKKKLAKVDY